MLKIRSGRLKRRLIGAMVAGGAIVAASTGLATAAGTVTVSNGLPYSPPFHQQSLLPITAATYSGAEPGQCGTVSSTLDGWEFIVPNDFTVFKSLTVTFSPGGTQTLTTFGKADFNSPNAMHAIVESAAGAQLTAASAVVVTVKGKDEVMFFNLSHTCPATSTSPSPSTSPSSSPSSSASASSSASSSPSSSPSASPSTTPPAPAPTPTPVSAVLPVTG